MAHAGIDLAADLAVSAAAEEGDGLGEFLDRVDAGVVAAGDEMHGQVGIRQRPAFFIVGFHQQLHQGAVAVHGETEAAQRVVVVGLDIGPVDGEPGVGEPFALELLLVAPGGHVFQHRGAVTVAFEQADAAREENPQPGHAHGGRAAAHHQTVDEGVVPPDETAHDERAHAVPHQEELHAGEPGAGLPDDAFRVAEEGFLALFAEVAQVVGLSDGLAVAAEVRDHAGDTRL